MATPPSEHTNGPVHEYWTQELSRSVEDYERIAKRRGESAQDVAMRELLQERRDVVKHQLNSALEFAVQLQHAVDERNRAAEGSTAEQEGVLEARTRLVEETLLHAPIIVPREFDRRVVREEFEATYDTDERYDASIRRGVVHELAPRAFRELVTERQRHGLQTELSVLVLGYHDGRFAVGRASLLEAIKRSIEAGHVRPDDLEPQALEQLNPQQRAAIERFAQRGRGKPA